MYSSIEYFKLTTFILKRFSNVMEYFMWLLTFFYYCRRHPVACPDFGVMALYVFIQRNTKNVFFYNVCVVRLRYRNSLPYWQLSPQLPSEQTHSVPGQAASLWQSRAPPLHTRVEQRPVIGSCLNPVLQVQTKFARFMKNRKSGHVTQNICWR